VESTGEWVLFSDADVHISRTLLRRVVAHAEARGNDYVALMPKLLSSGIAIDVVLTAFVRMLVVFSRVWKVEDPKSRAYAGGGVFALVRRSAYEKTKGLEWLKLEVGDDVAFGQMMKRSGLRCAVYNAGEDVRLYYYRSLRELYQGIEKNGAAVLGQYNLVRHFALAGVALWLEAGALAGLAAPWWSARSAAIAALVAGALAQVVVARWANRPILTAMVPVIGQVVLFSVLTRAAVLTAWRGSITWRGTRYDVKELRAGSRLEFP
jgi:hypothetical protein